MAAPLLSGALRRWAVDTLVVIRAGSAAHLCSSRCGFWMRIARRALQLEPPGSENVVVDGLFCSWNSSRPKFVYGSGAWRSRMFAARLAGFRLSPSELSCGQGGKGTVLIVLVVVARSRHVLRGRSSHRYLWHNGSNDSRRQGCLFQHGLKFANISSTMARTRCYMTVSGFFLWCPRTIGLYSWLFHSHARARHQNFGSARNIGF